MINVDMSNIWGELSLPELLEIEHEVSEAHSRLMEGTGAGAEYRGWLALPEQEETEEIRKLLAAGEKIREESDVCVVVGSGGAGARAAVELLQGRNRNIGKKPQLFFTGNNLSTRHWNELLGLLEGKEISVIALSKDGTEPEMALAFRALRWLLERKYGTDEARSRIYAVTDPEKGVLRQLAREEGWEAFSVPETVGGRFSVLTAAGLLPMAVAGIDIPQILKGAAEAKKEYDLRSFENPVWQYAAVRNVLLRKGRTVEVIAGWEPDFRAFGHWWQRLFGEAEGRGLLPVTAEYTEDLASLGQRKVLETTVRFQPSEPECVIGSDWKDLDGLNGLAGKTLSDVQEQAFLAAVEAHADRGVPVLTVDCGEICEKTVGELFWFLQLACGVSAYTLGVDPVEQPERAESGQQV